MASEPITEVAVEHLFYDWQNPRLAEFAVTQRTSQFDLLKILWENLAVREVALSIAHNKLGNERVSIFSSAALTI